MSGEGHVSGRCIRATDGVVQVTRTPRGTGQQDTGRYTAVGRAAGAKRAGHESDAPKRSTEFRHFSQSSKKCLRRTYPLDFLPGFPCTSLPTLPAAPYQKDKAAGAGVRAPGRGWRGGAGPAKRASSGQQVSGEQRFHSSEDSEICATLTASRTIFGRSLRASCTTMTGNPYRRHLRNRIHAFLSFSLPHVLKKHLSR